MTIIIVMTTHKEDFTFISIKLPQYTECNTTTEEADLTWNSSSAFANQNFLVSNKTSESLLVTFASVGAAHTGYYWCEDRGERGPGVYLFVNG